METKLGYSVIDGDGHIILPSDDWWKPYLPKRYWEWTPRPVTEPDGTKQLYAEGRPIPMATPSKARPFDKSGAFGGVGYSLTPGGWKQENPEAITMAEARRLGGADPKDRLKAMDTEAIDVSYLFPSQILTLLPALYSSAFALAIAQAYNDWLADYCSEDPRRLRPIGLVPQQDLILAAEEMARLRKNGVEAVMLRPNTVGNLNIDHPNYERIWAAAEDLDMAVCIHEGYGIAVPRVGIERVHTGLQGHVISHALEHMMACLLLITGGTLERHPRLRVAFMESGAGWAPFWLSRIDEHSDKFGRDHPPLKEISSTYFHRQCFLGVEPDDAFLPHLVDFDLADTLVYSSDFPHFDALFPGSVAALAERSDLSEAVKRKVLRDNAVRLYRQG